MVKDDSLYIIAIVAVVAVVGLVIMATGSSTTVVAQESLPDMVGEDSSAIAGQAYSGRVKSSISTVKTSGSSEKSPAQIVCEYPLFKAAGCTYNKNTDECDCPESKAAETLGTINFD